MADDPSLLAAIGIRVPTMFAGLAGGVVGAWADSKAGWKAWAAYVISGGLTANFLGEPALHFIPYVNEGGAGFIVGVCSLVIIKTIIGVAQKWHPKSGNGGNQP